MALPTHGIFLSLDYELELANKPYAWWHEEVFIRSAEKPGCLSCWSRDYTRTDEAYNLYNATFKALQPSVAVPGGRAVYYSTQAITLFQPSTTDEIYFHDGDVVRALMQGTDIIENDSAFTFVRETMDNVVFEFPKSSKLRGIPLVEEITCSHKRIRLGYSAVSGHNDLVLHFGDDGAAWTLKHRHSTTDRTVTCGNSSFCGSGFEAPLITTIPQVASKYLHRVDNMYMFRVQCRVFRLHPSLSNYEILGFNPVQKTLMFSNGGLVHIGERQSFLMIECVDDEFWPSVPIIAKDNASVIVSMSSSVFNQSYQTRVGDTLLFYDRISGCVIKVAHPDPTKVRVREDKLGQYECTDVWGRPLDNQKPESFYVRSDECQPVFLMDGRCTMLRNLSHFQTYIDPSMNHCMMITENGKCTDFVSQEVQYVNQQEFSPPRPQSAPIFVCGEPGGWFVVRSTDDHGCTTAQDSPDTAELEASLTVTPSTAGQVVLLSSNLLKRAVLVTRFGCTAALSCNLATMFLQADFDILEGNMLVSKANPVLKAKIYDNAGCAALLSLVYDIHECPPLP